MSDPEIARRCSACGVSVRQRAMFCPQCGNPIDNQPAATTIASVSDTMIDTAPTEALRPDLGATQPLTAITPPVTESGTKPAPRVYDDGVRGRVEKLRKVSSVVIDQAAYDPSLRFLLVAAAFFLLFLVLVILSKVIG